jgi:Cytotoxic translational repressor of toxin-antitoxin stability system
MNIRYSKGFQKEFLKQSGKIRESILNVIREVKLAETLEDITDCKGLTGYKNIYRIRIGNHRAFFYIEITEDTLYFLYLVSRGEAYKKEMREKLQNKDKEIQKEKEKKENEENE